jgi:hypothetical protein
MRTVSLMTAYSQPYDLDGRWGTNHRGLRTTCLSAVVRFLAITVLLDLRQISVVPLQSVLTPRTVRWRPVETAEENAHADGSYRS